MFQTQFWCNVQCFKVTFGKIWIASRIALLQCFKDGLASKKKIFIEQVHEFYIFWVTNNIGGIVLGENTFCEINQQKKYWAFKYLFYCHWSMGFISNTNTIPACFCKTNQCKFCWSRNYFMFVHVFWSSYWPWFPFWILDLLLAEIYLWAIFQFWLESDALKCGHFHNIVRAHFFPHTILTKTNHPFPYNGANAFEPANHNPRHPLFKSSS